jgi:hypothetical protein
VSRTGSIVDVSAFSGLRIFSYDGNFAPDRGASFYDELCDALFIRALATRSDLWVGLVDQRHQLKPPATGFVRESIQWWPGTRRLSREDLPRVIVLPVAAINETPWRNALEGLADDAKPYVRTDPFLFEATPDGERVLVATVGHERMAWWVEPNGAASVEWLRDLHLEPDDRPDAYSGIVARVGEACGLLPCEAP